MKSITIVNHWGLLTRWRSSLSLFILEAIRNIRLWNVLMADKLVAQYGREEIRVITDVASPRRKGGRRCGGSLQIVMQDLLSV